MKIKIKIKKMFNLILEFIRLKKNNSEKTKKQKCFSCKKNTRNGEVRRSGKFLCIKCIIDLYGGFPTYEEIKKKIKQKNLKKQKI